MISKSSKPYILVSAALISAVAGYTWYWHSAANHLMTEIPRWAEAVRAQGYALNFNELEISGFPYRFMVSASDVEISPLTEHENTQTVWSLQTPKLTGFVQPWDLSHGILEFQGPAEYLWNGRHYTVTADRALLSLSVGKGSLRRLSADFSMIRLVEQDHHPINIERAQFHLRPDQDQDGAPSSKVSLKVEGVTFPEGAASVLEPMITLIHLDGGIEGWAPAINRNIETIDWSGDDYQMRLDRFEILWPPIEAAGSGELTLDPQRRPVGRIRTQVLGYQSMVSALEARGFLSERKAATTRAALSMLHASQGNTRGRLNITAELMDGRLYLGPIKLLRLPTF